MNITRTTVRAAAALALLGAGAHAATARLAQGSLITLEGKSTLHPWKSESKDFAVDLTVGPGTPQALAAAIAAQAPGAMTVRIPVASLKSEHSGLDKNLRKALLADKNPDIVFAMKGYKTDKDSVTAWGDLTVAGKTIAASLNGTLKTADGKTVVDGDQPLKMTDFGVKPPSMMMGAVKAADDVVVKYHLVLEPGGDDVKGDK